MPFIYHRAYHREVCGFYFIHTIIQNRRTKLHHGNPPMLLWHSNNWASWGTSPLLITCSSRSQPISQWRAADCHCEQDNHASLTNSFLWCGNHVRIGEGNDCTDGWFVRMWCRGWRTTQIKSARHDERTPGEKTVGWTEKEGGGEGRGTRVKNAREMRSVSTVRSERTRSIFRCSMQTRPSPMSSFRFLSFAMKVRERWTENAFGRYRNLPNYFFD